MADDIKKVLDVLNSAYKADPAAIHCLCANAVPCNQALADHPTVQVYGPWPDPAYYKVGPVGLINAVVETLTGRKIAMSFSEGRFLGFIEAP